MACSLLAQIRTFCAEVFVENGELVARGWKFAADDPRKKGLVLAAMKSKDQLIATIEWEEANGAIRFEDSPMAFLLHCLAEEAEARDVKSRIAKRDYKALLAQITDKARTGEATIADIDQLNALGDKAFEPLAEGDDLQTTIIEELFKEQVNG